MAGRYSVFDYGGGNSRGGLFRNRSVSHITHQSRLQPPSYLADFGARLAKKYQMRGNFRRTMNEISPTESQSSRRIG